MKRWLLKFWPTRLSRGVFPTLGNLPPHHHQRLLPPRLQRPHPHLHLRRCPCLSSVTARPGCRLRKRITSRPAHGGNIQLGSASVWCAVISVSLPPLPRPPPLPTSPILRLTPMEQWRWAASSGRLCWGLLLNGSATGPGRRPNAGALLRLLPPSLLRPLPPSLLPPRLRRPTNLRRHPAGPQLVTSLRFHLRRHPTSPQLMTTCSLLRVVAGAQAAQ